MSTQFMQLYVGDYLRDTRHLTAEQHGAYLLLLMSMWAHGGELPNDPKKLARLACCTASRWAKISDDVLAFFDVEDDIITQARLRAELKKALEKSIKRAEAGMRGGDAKALKDKRAGLANASRLPCHYPEPEPDIEAKASLSSPPAPTPAKARSYPEAFEAAWKAYPHAKGRSSKSDSLTAWKKLTDAEREALPGACERYRREGREPRMDCGAPAMERWIKRGLHQHWSEGPARPSVAPADPQVIAHRLRRFRDTGVWEAGWGERPAELKAQIHA